MPIRFKTQLVKIGAFTIIRLPKTASAKLPSRGLVMAEGTINGKQFQAPLEPDGKGSHWLSIDKGKSGEKVTLELAPSKEWPEPKIPADLKKALAQDSGARHTWNDTTPLARWDWIRWIQSTKNPETRKKHVNTAISKLKSGEKRPCCFNRNTCTEQDVSKNGVLIEPTQE